MRSLSLAALFICSCLIGGCCNIPAMSAVNPAIGASINTPAKLSNAADAHPTTAPAPTFETFFNSKAVRRSFKNADVLFESGDLSYYIWTGLRTVPGEVEIHQQYTDIMYFLSGEAVLVIGGTPFDMREVAPHELRGPRSEGGREYSVSKDDVIIIPPNTPHWFKQVQGEIRYLTVKVKE